MLSVVVYGRNDNHGYNMHKRIAISLNCIAEVLTHENDEILYVDYNTSNDLPTVIEAIQDTLTDRAKKLTRVFRVRPKIHDRFKHKTHAQVNEPLARNIAIRRSNPKNRWVLSTNTDIVYTIVEQNKSLSDVVSNLQDGFYGIARFDVPEPLWESLDRKNPSKIIAKFADWGKSLCLNEVVYGNEIIKYDAPGDFQLALRDDLFKIHGFDEDMILGWHVDSNLCKRMHILRGPLISLQDQVYGYHCNHTRVSGWMHSVKRVENSIEKFFENVIQAELPNQEDWGLKNEEIEEIKIEQNDLTTSFPSFIKDVVDPLNQNYLESNYNKEGYDKIYYSTDHISPFLFEQFLNLIPNSSILYIGCNQILLDKINKFCQKLSRNHKLYYYQAFPESFTLSQEKYKLKLASGIEKIDIENASNIANLIIFDFGIDKKLLKDYSDVEFVRRIIDYQSCFLVKIASQNPLKPIKVVSVGAHNSRYYKNVKKFLNPIQNPYCSGIMVGRVTNHKETLNSFYREKLFNRLKNVVSNCNLLFLFTIFPIYFLFFLLNYKITYSIKLASANRKRRDADRRIKKLVLKKEITL